MCDERILPPDDLLALVDRTYGLSPDYEPTDLAPLADHVPVEITLGYDTQIRQIIAEPLAQMVADMRAAGLNPSIISGYRSYAAQRVAWNKWLINQPEYGAQLSAEPGHSEHQLGTTVDFGSPELPGIVGEENIQFHTYFYQTSEGIWLLANASEYGFSLSYPREAYEITGFFYEPWHYRYLGVEMATHLKNVELSLAEWHVLQGTVPCISDEE
jgi:D-alanyl-D-alanine carboxypeptidase